MRLHEYQSKRIFGKYGIPIPKAKTISSASQIKQITEELGTPVILKSQVRVSGRGKAGGIRLARDVKEAEEIAAHLLGMIIKGQPVHKLLVEQVANFQNEYYLAISTDRSMGCPVLIASMPGDVSIDEVASNHPEQVIKIAIDPTIGLSNYQVREAAFGMNLPKKYWTSFSEISFGLWRVFCETDAESAEINPLVIDPDKGFLALDGKLFLDENALFRHIELYDTQEINGEDPLVIEARKFGLNYVKLDGYIGCLVNGAGLAMATMDIIHLFGGKPANFLDIGGGADLDKVKTGLRIVISDRRVRSILINIFGGITHCDIVARGILQIIVEDQPSVPIIVRLVGTNSDEARKMLRGQGLITLSDTMDLAAQTAISVSGETVIIK